ncbi:MAG: cytoskeleton protein RodZ [Candidatus Azotimanducaceae bacterium]|jgi:cytoskeleton protein RodZ
MSEQIQMSEPGALPRVSIMLVEARNALGLSQKDVADQLFLTPTFIRYMDEGQFHMISKTAYIKGYLRTYARVVGISGDEVVAGYEETVQSMVEPVEMGDVTEEHVGGNLFTGPVILTGLVGLGILLLVVLLVWLFSGDDAATAARNAIEQEPIETYSNAADEVAPVRPLSLPERTEVDHSGTNSVAVDNTRAVAVTKASVAMGKPPADDSLDDSADERSSAVVNLESAISAAATPSVATAGGVASDVVDTPAIGITVENLGQGRGSLITVTAEGNDKLEFSFSDECWVEVTDATGESIYGDLNRTGNSLVIYGTAPFDVLFGKATAVQLAFNGEPVALSEHTSADLTAKVKLGR